MGFLKFLKRDKSKEPDFGLEEMEDLDMPPLPPDVGEKGLAEEGLPEMPEEESLPEIEEMPSPELKASLPEFPKLEKGKELGPKPMPSMPEFPELSQPRPLFGVQQRLKVEMPMPPEPRISPYEGFERAAVREEKAILRHKEAKGPIFIRVDRFKNILTGTNTIKSNLKIAAQTIAKLNEIDADRDKVFDKWHNAMTDLQKKLIFIDKTLFKR